MIPLLPVSVLPRKRKRKDQPHPSGWFGAGVEQDAPFRGAVPIFEYGDETWPTTSCHEPEMLDFIETDELYIEFAMTKRAEEARLAKLRKYSMLDELAKLKQGFSKIQKVNDDLRVQLKESRQEYDQSKFSIIEKDILLDEKERHILHLQQTVNERNRRLKEKEIQIEMHVRMQLHDKPVNFVVNPSTEDQGQLLKLKKLSVGRWRYQDETGTQHIFPRHIERQLCTKSSRIIHPKKLPFKHGGKDYRINIFRLEQVNVKTGYQRRIRHRWSRNLDRRLSDIEAKQSFLKPKIRSKKKRLSKRVGSKKPILEHPELEHFTMESNQQARLNCLTFVWECDCDGSWVSYPRQTQIMLNKEYTKAYVIYTNINGLEYSVDFFTMKMRSEVCELEFNIIDDATTQLEQHVMPWKNLEDQKFGCLVRHIGPPNRDNGFEVTRETYEFYFVQGLVNDKCSIANLRITAVRKYESPAVQSRFFALKETFKNTPGCNTDEAWVFHGTLANTEDIMKDGLMVGGIDTDVKNGRRYGLGVYTSINANVPIQYGSVRCSDGSFSHFKGSVILCRGLSGNREKDIVVPDDQKDYIIFRRSEQLLPQYVIDFEYPK